MIHATLDLSLGPPKTRLGVWAWAPQVLGKVGGVSCAKPMKILRISFDIEQKVMCLKNIFVTYLVRRRAESDVCNVSINYFIVLKENMSCFTLSLRTFRRARRVFEIHFRIVG